MAIAPRNRSRRQGSVTVLLPAAPAPAQAVGPLLEQLQRQWQGDGHLAALWQAWPRVAGPQLAQHCRPLRLQNGRLTVGASHPQWLQALRYSRHQLLAALRAAGFALHDLQIQQHQAPPLPPPASELEQASWQQHPAAWTCTAWATAAAASGRHRPANCSAGAIAASASGSGWPPAPRLSSARAGGAANRG